MKDFGDKQIMQGNLQYKMFLLNYVYYQEKKKHEKIYNTKCFY